MAHSALEFAKAQYIKVPAGTSTEKETARLLLGKTPDKQLKVALRYLEHHAATYSDDEIEEAKNTLENFTFRPTVGHIKKLLKRAISNQYRAVDDNKEDLIIQANCLSLFEKDYNIKFIENTGGALSWNYPLKMIIPTSEKVPEKKTYSFSSSSDDEFDNSYRKYYEARRRSALAQDSARSSTISETVPCSADIKSEPEMDVGSKGDGSTIKTEPSTSGARPKQKTEEQPATGSKSLRKSETEVEGKTAEREFPSRRNRKLNLLYLSSRRYTKLELQEEFEAYIKVTKQAAVARCRNRFPVPVALYNGKYICRSATLAVKKGVAFSVLTQPSDEVGRKKPEGVFPSLWSNLTEIAGTGKRAVVNVVSSLNVLLNTSMNDIKDLDVSVLKYLNVQSICDLMVENRKIKGGIRVSSSEKMNLNKYGCFKNVKIPYPGCEFFRQYHLAGRKAENLKFDWFAPEVECTIEIVGQELLPFRDVSWANYTEWDLVYHTQVYLRLILHFLIEGDGSVLVHCISGWDRTPLFISLLRLTLWADGVIHQSLNPVEITYLTLAYDWYLFGHDLPSRLERKEEILHFCFNVLPLMSIKHFLTQDVWPLDEDTSSETFELEDSQTMRVLQEHVYVRRNKLEDIKKIVLGYYEEMVTMG